jgi:cysteine-rich repeat protein
MEHVRIPLPRLLFAAIALAVSLTLPVRAAWATTIGPDAFDYTATDSVSFAFEDITSTGTRVLSGADDSSVTEPLGFTFPFYGQSFNTVSFSSNGLMTFQAGNSEFSNTDLTTSFSPSEACIAVFWDDLQFFQTGADAVYFATAGSAPSRRFIVQWNLVGHFSNSPRLLTFEAILFEGSGSILLEYQNVDTGDQNAFGASATVGIRDSDGEANGRVLQWSFDNAVLSNGSALLFTTSCGDGVIDSGEGCDDGNNTPGDGCDSACQVEACYTCSGEPSMCSSLPDGTACDDGLFCNGTDTCAGALCSVHTGVDPCAGGGAECNNVCNEATKNCAAPQGTPCTDDGNACTFDECDGAGTCTHTSDSSTDFAPCDDGVFCNGSDECFQGTCQFHSGDPCVGQDCATACDELAGQCDPVPAGQPCPDDGLACTADQCDGAGFCAHPPLAGGAPCPDDGNDCTMDECNGIGLCVHPAQPDGTACDDANACTQIDRCAGGQCVGTDPIVCTAPACHEPPTCDPSTGACTANTLLVRTDCRSAGKTKFRYQNSATDARDVLRWKWLQGAATTQAEFANPTTSADYQLCIFAETSESPALLMSADVPPTASSWHSLGHVGYTYSDKTGSDAGMRRILVKAGAAGHSKIILEGKGAALGDPVLPDAPVDELRIQLSNQATGVCWESEVPASAITGGIGGHSP